jgi:hypothetical protein
VQRYDFFLKYANIFVEKFFLAKELKSIGYIILDVEKCFRGRD